jgi:DNA repair exonuclease SbcCD ATPase subunit
MDAEHLPLALESLRELAQSRVVPLVLVISHSSDVQARMERVWTLARDPSTLDSTVHED